MTRPRLRTTHTVATLEVSATAYDEIAAKLRAAEYHHVFDGELIDMTGIGLEREAIRPGQPCGECHLQPGERCDVCGRTSALVYNHDLLVGCIALAIVLGLLALTADIWWPSGLPVPGIVRAIGQLRVGLADLFRI